MKKTCAVVLFMVLIMVIGSFGAFATEAEQAKHPCFVVASQVLGNESRSDIDTGALVMHLLAALEEEFSSDTSRVYTTGQSQGCILSISMDEAVRDWLFEQVLGEVHP